MHIELIIHRLHYYQQHDTFVIKLIDKLQTSYWTVNQQNHLLFPQLLTSWGLAILVNDESWIMEIIGTTKAHDPPITVGKRVPNKVWRSVLIPSTKSRVCTTLTLSPWHLRIKNVTKQEHIKIRNHKNQHDQSSDSSTKNQ